ncbi:D-alanyl-D-alanine carboxypeptidase (DacC) (PDB:1HD8) [Commensalibacter papalotli (ex Botero et al. 2024)]|uniref:serine-type D-Ala-D-Ala carboxypeptidase n=1 Tax=Commensalibacter papalotli (ex Botero et al. 2024) TaxID=2972766 RepID=A0ABN8W479_9PROT|nr:D-alanyl-D-alanine carboxypeptidase (DacC) (PDB:1HD8) [Commensalibacter papalotli (ex Botero et al. 2024)]CAI3929477.1 D-alanyl-D-alanine carboxypeptidase (DacC) (PDB:1HD8) [Commensalibacter papalotli (ex Botero et al. 2024)]
MPKSSLNRDRISVQTRRSLLTGASGLAFSLAVINSSPAEAKTTQRKKKTAASIAAQPAISNGPPANTPIGPFDTSAQYAFIMDYNTGTVLLDKQADQPMHPSSLTKIMTCYVVFAMLSTGRIKLDQLLPVSEKAWRMQGSKMFVPLNAQVSVQDLIQGVIIQSGNDACIVLAEGIAGSEQQFVAIMNDWAPKLGLKNTRFMNCTGWPDDNHLMSAHDIALIAYHLIHDYPQYYHFFSEKEFTYNKITQGNRNVLVDKGLADGLKTGHTSAGGYGLCASSERNGRRIILVANGMSSMNERAHECERLLQWGFNQFENVKLFNKGEVIETAPVWMGTSPTVSLVAGEDLLMTLPVGWRNKMKISLDYNAPIAAPITKGQVVQASLSVENGGQAIQIPVIAGESVPKSGLISRTFKNIGYHFGKKP